MLLEKSDVPLVLTSVVNLAIVGVDGFEKLIHFFITHLFAEIR